jgi:hypothetical protein
MFRSKLFLSSMLAIILVAGSMALAKDAASSAQARMTVGEFALRVLGLTSDDPSISNHMTAEQAVNRLRLAGVSFQGSAADPLSEKEKSSFFLAAANGLFDKLSAPPEGFEACAEMPKVPDCHACCLALPGSNNKSCGKACGRAHANLQTSPSEPTP